MLGKSAGLAGASAMHGYSFRMVQNDTARCHD